MEHIHEAILYPAVRVRTKSAGGSGTVIWSQPVNDEYHTYILTNHHVISDLIKVEDKYDPFIQRKLPVETRGTAQIEIFRYQRGSRIEGATSIPADIVAYDEKQDIALLKLRSIKQVEYVAKLARAGQDKDIQLLDRVYAVGAALGHPPMVTAGRINYMDDEMDDYEYWLSDAQIIFGNSGGAVYLESTLDFIGIPSRIAVAKIGWGADAITHMGFFIPFTRIWEWLKGQYYHFVYDDDVSYDECARERKKAQEEARRMVDVISARRSNVSEAKAQSGKMY